MKYKLLLFRIIKLSVITICGLTAVACSKQSPISDKSTVPTSSNPVVDSPKETEKENFMRDQDALTNSDKLVLQLSRANKVTKEISLRLLADGIKLAEKDRKEGLHGDRTGLAKLFCASAVGYPTIDGLVGCAESLVIDRHPYLAGKIASMKEASSIYRATLQFAERTNHPLPEAERQRILDNIKCLDNFVKSPEPKSADCELVKISLMKAPGIVKQNRTGVIY